MKNLNYLGLGLMILGAMACTKDPIASPIAKATAQDGANVVEGKINDAALSIKFGKLVDVDDFTAVKVTLVAAEGASIQSPGETVDFSKPVPVLVNNGVSDVTYVMTAEAPDPIKSILVGDKAAKIDGTNIALEYDANTMYADNIELTVNLRKGAAVKTPEKLVFDFTAQSTHKLVVTYLGKEFVYAVRLAGFEMQENLYEKAGWVNASEDFGSLPKYITVYKNKKLLGTKNEGVIVELDKRATLSVYGKGNENTFKLRDCYKAHNDAIIMLAGINGINQATISDSKVIYASGSAYPVLAQLTDGSFVLTPQKHAKEGDQYINNLIRLGADGKTVVEAKWLPKNAFGGYFMVATGGKRMERADMAKTGVTPDAGWFDKTYSRELVGVTKDGKAVLFVCDQVDGGVDMNKAIDMMTAVGCMEVMSLEGSGSPDLLINGKDAVRNSKIHNADWSIKADADAKCKTYRAVPAFK